MTKRAVLAILCVLTLAAFLPSLAFAQAETGRLTGRVTDEQGGALPGAIVTVRLAGAQAGGRTATSDGSGNYTITNLLPGNYQVAVEKTGFRRWETSIPVPVGGTVTLDAKLPVGGVTETVTVTSEVSEVNLRTQEVITRISAEQIANLPTLTRNPYDLVALAGNVSSGDPVNDGAVLFRGVGYAINGQRTSSVNVLLDGSANNDEFTSAVGMSVPLDSVQEFSVVTSSFSPQYGRAGGGIVNVATKAGSNRFTGTAYEYFRNDAMSAENYDNKARGLPKGKFRRHQPGFAIGGPITRDRAFFFTSFEHIRIRSNDQLLTWVPTPQLLAASSPETQAFFAAHSLATPINGPILTRGEVTVGTGPAWTALPANLPVFGQVQQTVPIDAGGGTPQDTNLWVSRVDLNVRQDMTMYFRYALEKIDWQDGTNSQSPWAGYSSGFNAFNHNLLFSATNVLSPSLASQTKFVFNRLKQEQPLGDQPPSPTLYMNPTRAERLSAVRIGFPGYLPFSPGSAIPFGGPQALFQIYQDFHWLRGNHDFQFGGSYVRIADDRTFGAYMNAVEGLGANMAQSLDNFVTGDLIRFQVAIDPQGKFPGDFVTLPVGFPSFTRNNRYNEFGFYVGDSWRMTDRMTVNLGMRYEFFGVQHNSDPNLDANFYYGPCTQFAADDPRCKAEGVLNGSVMRAPESPVGGLWEPDYNNFAPRVGFAYDLTGDGRTSLRGGYGIGYERNFGNVTFNVMFNPPNYAVVTLTPADIAVIKITPDNAGPFAGNPGLQKLIPRSTLRHVDQDIETAYAHFWSLSLQRQLSRKVSASVEYSGSAGRKLYDLSDYNKPGAGEIFFGNGNLGFLNPQYSFFNTRGNRGRSNYNAVVFGLNTRDLADLGLTMNAKYTFAVARDNLSSTFSEGQNGNGQLGFTDAFDPELDYGYAEFDVRHRGSLGFIWALPFGEGTSGMKNALVAGWQVQGVWAGQSGTPFTVYDCSFNTGVFCMRMLEVAPIADGVRNPPAVEGEPNRFRYIDLTNQASGVGTYFNEVTGTSDWGPYPDNMTKRNQFRGPGRWTFDMAVSKDFEVGGGRRAQFRIEFYNLFNHANLYVIGSEAFMPIDYVPAARGLATTDQRRVQLGFKFLF